MWLNANVCSRWYEPHSDGKIDKTFELISKAYLDLLYSSKKEENNVIPFFPNQSICLLFGNNKGLQAGKHRA